MLIGLIKNYVQVDSETKSKPRPKKKFARYGRIFWNPVMLGSPMKKSDFHRSNSTPIQCMQAIDLYVKTTKRAMLTLSFLAEK